MIWPDGIELGEALRRVPKRLADPSIRRSMGVIGLVFSMVGLGAVGGPAIGATS